MFSNVDKILLYLIVSIGSDNMVLKGRGKIHEPVKGCIMGIMIIHKMCIRTCREETGY